MKIKVLILVFAMIFTMIVPAQANTSFPQENSLQAEEFFGKYVVSVKTGEVWNEVGSLTFGKNQTKKTINIENYLNSDSTIVKLAQNGGGSAYLDAVLLGENPALKVSDNNEKVLNKLSKEDLDITPVGVEGVILEFASCDNVTLTVAGRIEPVVISKEPLQFPIENAYKSKDDIQEFYSYILDNNIGTVIVDGILEEIKGKDPFVKEFRKTGSGHPFGDTYFWVMNDDKNLYVTLDATPDNTFDGDKDYAKVFINANEGIKEFKVSVLETKWGSTSFIYTDKVNYEHKVYEFEIPLSELGIIEGKIEIAFALYGTATAPPSVDFGNPDIAFDNKNYYLSVFDYGIYENYSYKSYICGEILDSNGNVISDKFPIYNDPESYNRDNRTPTVSYDIANNNFLVVWAQSHGDAGSELMACTVKINDVGNPVIGEAFPVSGNVSKDDTYYVSEPELTYGKYGQFLLIWKQTYYGTSLKEFVVYGRIIDSKNAMTTSNFAVTNDEYQHYPKASYDPTKDVYIITWYRNIDGKDVIEAQVVKSSGETTKNGFISIAENGKDPHVSLHNLDLNKYQFLVTWYDDYTGNLVKGQYIEINSELIPEKTGNIFLISPDDEYSYYSPVSYNDGNNNMLCVWISTLIESNKYYANLQYIGNSGEHLGDVFYTDEYDSKLRDNLHYDSYISITGDNNGSIIIAYNHKYRPTVDEYDPKELGLDQSVEYTNSVGYRMFGKYKHQYPYIKFSNAPFEEIVVGDTLQAIIKLYNAEFPDGIEINNNKNLYCFSEENNPHATISKTGLITGISAGETSVVAIYDPWATIKDDGSVSFSDGLIKVEKPAIVKIIPKSDPSLTIVPNKIEKFVGDKFSVKINYFDGSITTDVTNEITITFDNPNLVTSSAIRSEYVCTIVGDTILRTTHAGIEAIATLKIREKDVTPGGSSGGSSASNKTPIGEISVNNKVIKVLYVEDINAKNGSYTFTADKEGDRDKIWIDSSFYKELAKDNPTGRINFICDKGTYTLPLNCKEVLNEIGSTTKRIIVSIEKLNDKDIIKAAKNSAENMGGQVISDLVDFSVSVEKTNGNKKINSLDFYAVRTITGLDVTPKNISTAMKFVEDKKILTFAPSVFSKDTATIKYRGNGIFAIIENPQTFSDIGNHWAKMNIEKLASRNIAFGRQNKMFAPNDFVTRAEFAVMITRALGITEEEGTNDFKDVTDGWFAEDISTAFEAKLINGRKDGKFYPNEKIQRKDMAVIINNALKFTGSEVQIANIEKVLSMFNDSNLISEYAKESTAVCANAGIILGRDTLNFDPNENATRAEASAIIERMLRYLEFMD